MAEIIISGGAGGGVGSDELTAISTNVLNGATYVGSDTDDDIGTGTMANKQNASTSATVSFDSANSRVQMAVPERGCYNTSSKLYSAASNFGDAQAPNVLTGSTFSSTAGIKTTGTMANNGAVSPPNLDCGGAYTIPIGYHNGNGKVTANSLSSQTGVDSGKTAVTAATMLTGCQGWVNGAKVSGTMANQGEQTQALNCGGSYTIPAGYHNGNGKVTANSLSSQTGVDSGKTAVTAATMLTGYQGWVNGTKISGTMANQGKKTQALDCDGSYTIPAGYHNGEGKVTANSLSSQTGVESGKTAVIASAMLSGYQGWVNGVRVSGTIATYDGSIS